MSAERQALAEQLLREQGLRGRDTSKGIERSGATDGLPLSFAQERLWFLEQLVPETAVYNTPTVVRLRGPLRLEALDASLTEVVRRHAALRTVLREEGGQPVASLVPAAPVTIPLVDLTTLPASERERVALTAANQEARIPFNLTTGPLLRVRLWRLAPDDHLFLILTHHIISDAWSMALLFEELEVLYEEHGSGIRPRALPDLPVDYADYARWERSLAESGEHSAHVEYWIEKLARLPEPLLLSTDHARSFIATQRGTIAKVSLPRELSRSLIALSRAEGATLFMTLLTGYQVLLHRYTGHRDILVGSPISTRSRIELEKLIGFFLGTIVLRTPVTDNPTFRALLHSVRETTLEAFRHQDAPFERIVAAVQPSRDLSHHPVFQTMFALQNTPPPRLRLSGMAPGVVLGEDEVHSGTTKIELGMIVEQVDEALTVWLEYATELFEPQTIERLLGHYRRVLETMVAGVEQRIGEFSLLSEPEQRQVRAFGNWSGRQLTHQRTVVEMVAECVRTTPDAVAVASGAVAWCYRELDSRANQLARYLQVLGVGRESLVGVCLERSPEMVAAQLAIMKAGGAYVPLDPAYPRARLDYLISDATLTAVITDERLAELIPVDRTAVVCLDRDARTIATYDQGPMTGSTEPGHLAYVIYTSGSTGRPKGVEIEHRGLTNLVNWHREAYAVTAADRATLLAAVGFDASVWETWPYLAAGASIHAPDEDTRMSPSALLDWLRDREISITFLPTPLLEAVLQVPMPRGLKLRSVLTGGDRLTRRPGQDVPFPVVNHYGPTEYTVVTTAGDVAPSGSHSGPPTIGRPIGNTNLSVLDEYGNHVPVGVPGELYVSGLSLARGYHRRPELTAERFVPITIEGSRIRAYRTGDLVRYLSNGEVDFLGRLDEQVKVQGVRIELGEVETILSEHPAVREAVVAMRKDGNGEGRLVGYVTFSPGEELTTSEVRRWLSRLLPKYMVPSVIIGIDTMPVSPNGKLDRGALPNPFAAGQTIERSYEAPGTELERLITETWQRLLTVDRVGRHDNFYELGGHSLLSIRAVAAIAERTGVRLNPRIFFFQDVAQIAAALASGQSGG